MLRRRRRRFSLGWRLSPFGILLLIALVLVIAAICFPSPSVLTKPEKSPAQPELIIKKPNMISVYSDSDVIQMALEEYLVCVVAAEMPASYEPEALKAQAVAARTYTLYKKNNGGCSAHNGADICTNSSHCQAYITKKEMEINWGDEAKVNLEKIQTAVNETKGQVLLYQGEEIQVFYHASSGGQTENCENVYSQALPYLVGVKSDGEQDSRNFYGEVEVTADRFTAAMKKYSPSIQIDTDDIFSGIGKITRFDSGRVQSIKIGNETFTGREIREIFSLNSANFTINIADNITFSTIGFGHGVGMSQTGANAMAKQGASYAEILSHYYTGVTIE